MYSRVFPKLLLVMVLAVLATTSGCAAHFDTAHSPRGSHANDAGSNHGPRLRGTGDRPAWTAALGQNPADYKRVAVLVIGNYSKYYVRDEFVDMANSLAVARVSDVLQGKGYSLVTRSADELSALYDEIGFQSKQTGNSLQAERMVAKFGAVLGVSAVFVINIRVAIENYYSPPIGVYSTSIREIRVPDGANLGSGTRLFGDAEHGDAEMVDLISRMVEEIAFGIPAVGGARP